jgi:hypothetical protein
MAFRDAAPMDDFCYYLQLSFLFRLHDLIDGVTSDCSTEQRCRSSTISGSMRDRTSGFGASNLGNSICTTIIRLRDMQVSCIMMCTSSQGPTPNQAICTSHSFTRSCGSREYVSRSRNTRFWTTGGIFRFGPHESDYRDVRIRPHTISVFHHFHGSGGGFRERRTTC